MRSRAPKFGDVHISSDLARDPRFESEEKEEAVDASRCRHRRRVKLARGSEGAEGVEAPPLPVHLEDEARDLPTVADERVLLGDE